MERMSVQETKRSGRDLFMGFIVVSMFFVGGAVALASFFNQSASGIYSLSWPDVVGQVISVKTRILLGGPESNDSVCLDLKYRYSVDAIEYQGERQYFGNYCYDTEEDALVVMQEKYHPGNSVNVFYGPLNNRHSVLEPGISWSFVTPVVFGLPFLLVGIFGYVFLYREMMNKK